MCKDSIFAQVSMRYESVVGIGNDEKVKLNVNEMLLNEFPIQDLSSPFSKQVSQILNMKNVSYTARMDQFLGAYGPAEHGFAFEPIMNDRVSSRRDSHKTAIFDDEDPENPSRSDSLYRGMIMMHTKQQSYVFTSFSFIDLVSASGGIITGLMAVFGPIAGLFSKLNFELGVISLLFSAKSIDHDQKP